MAWSATEIQLPSGKTVTAKEPLIISASRATDIPAFYPEWFMRQWRNGYIPWKNPFNGRIYYYSFARTRVIVFWSKNPAPLIPYLNELQSSGVNFYFQFTLNDYEQEQYEPDLPPLHERIETFRELSRILGSELVIWRFDPLFLTERVTRDTLLHRVDNLAKQLTGYTRRLVFSFADIAVYGKVKRNLDRLGIRYELWDEQKQCEFVQLMAAQNGAWNLDLRTCAEPGDYLSSGVYPNKCIDDELMIRHFYQDRTLMQFLGVDTAQKSIFERASPRKLKDKGQRKHCRCILSKDIGVYNTCKHRCVYCYANQY